MLNLHEAIPNHFTEDEFVAIDLDACYRQHSPHSHLKALEVIFAEGVRYSDEIGDHNASEHEKEVNELLGQIKILEEKYNLLLAKLNQSTEVSENAERIAVAQTLGMGNNLK